MFFSKHAVFLERWRALDRSRGNANANVDSFVREVLAAAAGVKQTLPDTNDMLLPASVPSLPNACMAGLRPGHYIYRQIEPVQQPVPAATLDALLPEIVTADDSAGTAREPTGPVAFRHSHRGGGSNSSSAVLQAAPELMGKHFDPYAPAVKQLESEEVREHAGGRLRMRLAARSSLPTGAQFHQDGVNALRRMFEAC